MDEKCSARQAVCECGEVAGHDGPHVCSDHERCDGSWDYDAQGEFVVVRWPKGGLLDLLSGGLL